MLLVCCQRGTRGSVCVCVCVWVCLFAYVYCFIVYCIGCAELHPNTLQCIDCTVINQQVPGQSWKCSVIKHTMELEQPRR